MTRLYWIVLLTLLFGPTVKAANSIDVSGSYVSNLVGNITALRVNDRSAIVTLSQNGNAISGTYSNRDGSKTGQIWGNLDQSEIRFDWLSSKGDSGTGKWIVDPSSGDMTGTWGSYLGNGTWNLTRTSE